VESAILRLMPIEKGPQRGFKLSAATNRRLQRLSRILDKSDTAIIEDAVAHLLGTLERDEPVRMTSPSDDPKRHKRPPDAA
jgi:hypothetical protein